MKKKKKIAHSPQRTVYVYLTYGHEFITNINILLNKNVWCFDFYQSQAKFEYYIFMWWWLAVRNHFFLSLFFFPIVFFSGSFIYFHSNMFSMLYFTKNIFVYPRYPPIQSILYCPRYLCDIICIVTLCIYL